jgi:hypothetical protein
MVSKKTGFLSAFMFLMSVNVYATPIYSYSTPVFTGSGGSVQYEFNFNDENHDMILLWTEIESINYALDGGSWNSASFSGGGVGNFGCIVNSSAELIAFSSGAVDVFSGVYQGDWQLVTGGNASDGWKFTAQGFCRYNGCTTVPMSEITGGSVQIPEPSTLAILTLGMVGLASRRFKKQS